MAALAFTGAALGGMALAVAGLVAAVFTGVAFAAAVLVGSVGFGTGFAGMAAVFFTAARVAAGLAGAALDFAAGLAATFLVGLVARLTAVLARTAFAAGFFGPALGAGFFAAAEDALPAAFFLVGVAGRIVRVVDALALGFATRASSDQFRQSLRAIIC